MIAALEPRPDAVFNALHGRFGEDGAIQGVLDWMGIPYTHSGVRASSLAMDKQAAKAAFAAAGLPVARGRVVDMAELEAADPVPLPYVVKPLNEGSSVGVTILRDGDNRRAEIARAWRFGRTAMVEEYVPGRELTVGVMHDRALAVTEIVSAAGFYDYDSKYADGGSRHIVPAAIHPRNLCPRHGRGAGRAPGAGLPRRHACGPALRRHGRGARAARAARGQHAAGPDPHQPAAGTGGASRHRLRRAVHLDGRTRGVPRMTRPPLSGARTPAKPPRPLADRPTRWQLLRRRKRRLLRPLIALVVLAAIGLAGAWAARTLQPGQSLATLRDRIGAGTSLVVQDVVIEGRSLTPEPMLRAALGVSRGDKLLGISLDAARQRIEGLTWVEHATVERRLPGTLVVQLTERRPFAVWQSGGKFQLIDRAGQVVAEQDPAKDAAAFAVLPLVVGPGAPEHAAALLDQLAAQPALRARVVAAVRVGERRWNLRLNNGADVLLPEGAELPAMARLMELHATQALLDRPLQTLDMRLPDRMVIRPQAEPRTAPPMLRRPT